MELEADINKRNSVGDTPLFIACEKGYISIIKYLMEQGADINTVDNLGRTILDTACYNGHITIVKSSGKWSKYK